MLDQLPQRGDAGPRRWTRAGCQLFRAVARDHVRQLDASRRREVARGDGGRGDEREHRELEEQQRDERLDEGESAAVGHAGDISARQRASVIVSTRGAADYSRPYSRIL